MSDDRLRESIDSWFARYDELSRKGDVEGMANMAMFPVHVVTDDSDGNGRAESWTRDQFVDIMTEAMKGMPENMRMEAVRTPFLLTDNLAVVITDATVTAGGEEQTLRYADILAKAGGDWKFQTMAQGGWGDMLKARNAQGSA
ncbi:MAG: nuclear transport factor 2 family protein [Dehalococcoidia bacterium]